jgi:hypothetical protein
MKLVVITPVGPGHEDHALSAVDSVKAAIAFGCGRFTSVEHRIVDDTAGRMGRSRARNEGMDADGDWFFFLDADDVMAPAALTMCDFDSAATFGLVCWEGCLEGRSRRMNVLPCGWRDLALFGARGTLSMGFFVRAELARSLRFNETMNIAEDYDFYVRLPAFTKVGVPLVNIGYYLPSAGGPRGYDEVDWVGACDNVIRKAVEKEPEKYDLRGDAILAKSRYTPRQRRALLQALQRA